MYDYLSLREYLIGFKIPLMIVHDRVNHKIPASPETGTTLQIISIRKE